MGVAVQDKPLGRAPDNKPARGQTLCLTLKRPPCQKLLRPRPPEPGRTQFARDFLALRPRPDKPGNRWRWPSLQAPALPETLGQCSPPALAPPPGAKKPGKLKACPVASACWWL